MKKTIFPKVALTLILLLIGANSAAAYDNDTHFWLTYYLARKVGYTHIQAMQIASADISVDLDKDTKPVTPRLRFLEISDYPKIHGEVRYKFHALPRKEEANKITGKPYLWWDPTLETQRNVKDQMTMLVDRRKKEFWEKVLSDKRNPGMFLHFLQDSFSHRGFKGYIGHAGYSKIDFLASDHEKTTLMVKETLRYLIAFREVFEGRSTVESMLDPSAIDPERYLTPAGYEEVKTVTTMFEKVNRSDGEETNAVWEAWDKLESEFWKTREKLPAGPVAYALGATALTNPAPDSRKARDIVKRELNLNEKTLPLIWHYNYDRDGYVEPYSHRALTYTSDSKEPKQGEFTSFDEEKNLKSATKGEPVRHPCRFNLDDPRKPEALCLK